MGVGQPFGGVPRSESYQIEFADWCRGHSATEAMQGAWVTASVPKMIEAVQVDPLSLARSLGAENEWLRGLLHAVATELERLADGASPELRASLLARAARIRRRLHEGAPKDDSLRS